MLRAGSELVLQCRCSQEAVGIGCVQARDLPRVRNLFLTYTHLLHLSRTRSRAALLEQELGVIAACQVAGRQFNTTVSAGVGSLFGTNLILPGRGAPLRFCGTILPDWCLPEKDKDIVTQSMGHRQVIPSYTTHKLRGKIPQMARGWESKSVEQQQEDMSEQRKTVRPPISPDEQQRNRKREGLLLSRKRLTQQLQAAYNPRHRQMLQQAIAELDRQLSSF